MERRLALKGNEREKKRGREKLKKKQTQSERRKSRHNGARALKISMPNINPIEKS